MLRVVTVVFIFERVSVLKCSYFKRVWDRECHIYKVTNLSVSDWLLLINCYLPNLLFVYSQSQYVPM